jgi:glycosyltransferase involved in cell wall biosynthesis
MWALASFPAAERWCGPVDWVYCPFEVFVPTRTAKLAATFHGMHWFEKSLSWYQEPAVRRARRRLEPFFRRIVEGADLILAVSEFLKGRLCELFHADPSRIAVVGNGAEEEFFVAGRQPPPTWEALTASPYVLAVTALESWKGAECILQVARALHRAAPNVKVIVAAGNWGVSPYVEEGRTIPNLELRRYVGSPDLVGLMHGALALLFPSRYETFGIPVVEAMACGTPVIAANLAGLPEVVGDAGILVDPFRTAEVVDAVRALLRDPILRESYRNAGLRRSENFTWDRCAGRMMAAIRERA